MFRKGRLLTPPYRLILTWINDYNRSCEEEVSTRFRHLQNNNNEHQKFIRILLQSSAAPLRPTHSRVLHGFATKQQTALPAARPDVPSGIHDFHRRHHRRRLVHRVLQRHCHRRPGHPHLLRHDRPAGLAGDAHAG
ncbi:conserved protein of unknown function [Pseudomonas sp. JV551A1]|uniref:Uncharacterized protein n=1 Tax=Pseudomonas inefficax TaxID=2078786 RepID=A0AAQ1PDQ2_9PSED|nr:conserved protein of unknown function [Pseudomonas sp. JV551A1]SPO62483.1 conserved protein of unknown function [Pseudomonas inefficax]